MGVEVEGAWFVATEYALRTVSYSVNPLNSKGA